MKNSKYISLILTFIGMITLARTSNAQGKIAAGTATISVTVVRGTGVSFSPSKSVDKSSPAVTSSVVQSESGITLHSTSNVMVQFNSSDGSVNSRMNFRQGDTKTITAKELRGVKSVQIVYLGI